MSGLILDIPSISQSNSAHDKYVDWSETEDGETQGWKLDVDAVQSDGVVVEEKSGKSTRWCGRASASMIYNYFQLVDGYVQGKSEKTARNRFIVNNRKTDSGRPLDLIFPDGEIVCYTSFGGGSYYYLAGPLNRSGTQSG